MARAATLSTTIDPAVKRALVLYSKGRGLKIRYVVERAIVELIEDQSDLAVWRQRRDEPTVAWAETDAQTPCPVPERAWAGPRAAGNRGSASPWTCQRRLSSADSLSAG